jgi:hypothetical protein
MKQSAFDALITKVNAKKVEDKKHFKQINVELEQTANQLIVRSSVIVKKNIIKYSFILENTNSLYICSCRDMRSSVG